jgi:hypothetical protein
MLSKFAARVNTKFTKHLYPNYILTTGYELPGELIPTLPGWRLTEVVPFEAGQMPIQRQTFKTT